MLGLLVFVSPQELSALATWNSMFDCPEHKNTSPTSTSATFCSAPELDFASSSYGPPAFNAGSCVLQWPDLSAFAEAWDPFKVTVTVSPALASPHTVTS